MSLRTRILPVIDRVRAKIDNLGLRPYEVAIRRKDWPDKIGAPGTTPTITDFLLTPRPRVRIDPPWTEQETGTQGPLGSYTDRIYTIDRITPFYTKPDNTTSGFRPQEFDLIPDNRKQEAVLVLIGDDGVARECEIISREFDRVFNYRLKVRLKRRAQT